MPRDPGGGPETRRRRPVARTAALEKGNNGNGPSNTAAPTRRQLRRPSQAKLATAARFLAPGRWGRQ